MTTSDSVTKSISGQQDGRENENIFYQLTPSELHEITIKKGMGKEAATGA